MALEQFKQFAQGLVDFGSGFDQANTSLAFDQELGFLCARSQKDLNSTVLFKLCGDVD